MKEMLAARAKEAEQIVVKPTGAAASPSTSSGRTGGAGAGSTAVRGEPVEPRTGGKAALEAKVLVVNREYNFVVLNVGSKDGIRKGSRFSITRGSQALATAEADKVYDNMVAANLLEEAKKGDIREGDAARLIS